MPTVLRVGAFRVVVSLPPCEHGPPHVHVHTAEGEVIIELASAATPQFVRKVKRVRDADVATAFWIVEQNADLLMRPWWMYHA